MEGDTIDKQELVYNSETFDGGGYRTEIGITLTGNRQGVGGNSPVQAFPRRFRLTACHSPVSMVVSSGVSCVAEVGRFSKGPSGKGCARARGGTEWS